MASFIFTRCQTACPAITAEIFHGTHFVLVDGQGPVRGYYESGTPDTVDRVVRDAALFVNGG